MGRGKATPKKNPTPGGRADRKVVLEYSSDETPDENAPQPAEGAQAPKRVKKQIHLTLPMSPAHITTTETFSTFFINHGLTRALQKAFAKRGWSTDQMREFVTNFQKKHGQQVPMPQIYGHEDSTDSEGPELADGKRRSGKPQAAHVVVTAPVPVVRTWAGPEVKREAGTTLVMMTPPSAERRAKMHHQSQWWPAKSHARRPQVTPQLTESCQSFTSPARKRGPCWVTVCWTGLMSRRGRSMRRGCRGDR